MRALHLRYFAMALVASFILAAAVGGLIVSLTAAASGAAFIAGWWTNLAVAGTVGIMGGRKAGQAYEDPRLGRVAGTAAGLWVGAGGGIGMLAFAVFARNVYHADVRIGLVLVFMLVTFFISLIAAAIAGREVAHPPEEEEA